MVLLNDNTPNWPIGDFSLGKNDFLEDSLIADNECADAQNCICVTPGLLQKRKGQAKLNSVALAAAIQGMYAYYFGTTLQNRRIYVASNGKVYYWTGSGFTEIRSGLSTVNPIMFETCATYMVGFDGTAPFKHDGTTSSVLAGAPLTGMCPVLHKEKLFVYTDHDTTRWADSFNPESWPGVNEWTVGDGDGDELSLLAKHGETLLCCKKRRLFVLKGSSLDDFRSECLEQSHGVVGPRAGFVKEPFFFYISYEGPQIWDSLKSTNLIEARIPRTWANVNTQYLHTSVAGYNAYYNQAWFIVPEGASTTPNLVLAYDLKLHGWWILRNILANCMMEFNSGTSIKLYTGHPALGHVIEQNTGYNDLGSAIEAYWVGPNFDDKDPVRIKNFGDVFAVDVAGLNEAIFKYRINSGSWVTPTVRTDINDVRRYRLINARGRQYQPRFEHNTLDQDFCLSGMKTYYDPGLNK